VLSPLLTAALLLGCPPAPSDPSELAPDTTTALAGVDVDAFAQSPTGAALVSALTADLALAEALEIAGDCGVTLDQTYALVLARDADDGRMLAVQARGLGDATTLACLETELRARSQGAAPWVREPTPCADSLALPDGGRVWILNSYTLVAARGSFVDPIADKLAGVTPIGLPRGLDVELGQLDRSGHLWLAARLSEADRVALPGAWAREAESLTVAVDLRAGMRAVVSLSASTAAALASTRDHLLASLAQLADRLDEYGVEHRLRERARVGILGDVVAAELELDPGELRSIRAQIGEQIHGRGPL
jgi:hypothetical protein